MSIMSKIQSLITAANTVTGESRTDLTSAVQDLKDGYGQGGGITVVTGTFTVSEIQTQTAKVITGDFTNVIGLQVFCDKAELAAATKTNVAPYLLDCPKFPDSYTQILNGYIGLSGSMYGYNASNQERSSIIVASRGPRIKVDGTEIIIGGGSTTNQFVPNVTYTYKVYKAEL